MGISEKAKEFAGLPVVDFVPAAGLVLTSMPRREFRPEDGATFWAIALDGDRITAQAGKASSSKTTPKVFKTPQAARAEYAKRIAEKVKEGYAEHKPATPGSTREALAAAVAADPDDAASRNAYADWLAENGVQLPPAAWRIDRQDYDDDLSPYLEAFLADPAAGLVPALVIGGWEEAFDTGPDEIVEALAKARKRLTGLRGLFIGDMPYEDCEISWINQCDLTPLLKAFPKLEHFRSRGGDGLELKKLKHESLESLTIEASNLKRDVVRAIGTCDLPALERLEIWLGTDRYGADTEARDLKGVLEAKKMPALTHLGLRNSQIADEVAAALAKAPVLARLRSLDLSLGVLTDAGAEALLANPGIARLEKLDIHHHFVSPALVKRLKALGPEVDASDSKAGEDEDYRYVAHAE